MMPGTLPEACDYASELCVESTASAVGLYELSLRAKDLKQFVDQVFHPLLNTETSGQLAREMAGIMSDIGALKGEFIALANRFETVHSVLSEMRID